MRKKCRWRVMNLSHYASMERDPYVHASWCPRLYIGECNSSDVGEFFRRLRLLPEMQGMLSVIFATLPAARQEWDTVGECSSAEIFAIHMLSLKGYLRSERACCADHDH